MKSNIVALDSAVNQATSPALLSRIAKSALKIDDLGQNETLNTVDLAVEILQNRKMRELVGWFMAEVERKKWRASSVRSS